MTQDFERGHIVAHGPSTRVVQLTTGERVSFAPEALEGMVRQARESFIAMNIEHLNMLPPIGRWSDGEVKTLEDGEQQLLLYGEFLQQYVAKSEFDDPFRPEVLSEQGAPEILTASISAEARNFDPEVWRDAVDESPLPVKETHKWSDLPPLEWVLVVPVAWGAAKFMGSFLERLGQEAAEAVVAWFKRTSRKARDAGRDRYVTISFELDDDRQVSGFIPFAAADDDISYVQAALGSAGMLAEIAGALNEGASPGTHQITYLWDGSTWQLAWFVNDDGVFLTKYFTEHRPDPERFLGRPMFPELPTDDSADGSGEPAAGH
ncbi:hypothetical protein GCM10009789_65820 [Kribbella sancticallisti]|uniref:SUKH-3 immunity protein n=2 Tax=Kribbella sancticallisti TaxID=460087 RepID=A0ABP4QAD1_9ACTN